jgi:hypothetical protein
MDAEYLTIDDSGQSKEIEDLTAGLPYGCIAIFGLAFFVKTIDLSNLAGLVVSTNERDTVGKSCTSACTRSRPHCQLLT